MRRSSSRYAAATRRPRTSTDLRPSGSRYNASVHVPCPPCRCRLAQGLRDGVVYFCSTVTPKSAEVIDISPTARSLISPGPQAVCTRRRPSCGPVGTGTRRSFATSVQTVAHWSVV